ncbi:ATP-binding protein [Umezawaea sp. NPDC059074]|uniref:ATP-binding protein n=1 Tax=Umezawaea sp. NPDC059074 TaxID=3346716 RepID=UPI00367F680E
METKQVRAGKGTILSPVVERASAVDILAELIWNALDAEATNVETTVLVDGIDTPVEIIISDNGHGMPHADVHDLFLTHSESWKQAKRFSPNINRPLHGQLGRGRFLAYAVADRVEWRSVSEDSGSFSETVIQGYRRAPHEFSFDGPFPSDGPTGTTVRLHARQTSRVVSIAEGDIHLPLTARLASSLFALPEVTVLHLGRRIDPQAHVNQTVELELDVDLAAQSGMGTARLQVVEWATDMKSKTMYLCDDRGAVVTEYKPARLPPAPIHWTAYLRWEGFRDPELMRPADLLVPEMRHGELLGAAQHALAGYLNGRLDEQKGRILAEWKAEGVYPYLGEARSAAEEVEREIFDVVAVVASPAIGRDHKQKKLSLRLLQEMTRAKPTRTNRALNAILDLSDEEQEVLIDLLERTELSSIVRAAQTIADRSDFLHGLRGLLYSDETKSAFREVDQLHPMLVSEPWVFGDEWSLALSESGLTRVVQTIVGDDDVAFASSPVLLPSGRRGRVDMVFSRHLPESERTRHLVVELKRPMTLTMTEFGQINNYAAAITEHPEVQGTPHDWDFWLVGTAIDKAVRNLHSDPSRPGLTTNNPHYRIWVTTWGQLLDQAERRVQAIRAALELVSTEETSRAYLQRRHSQFIPPEAGS